MGPLKARVKSSWALVTTESGQLLTMLYVSPVAPLSRSRTSGTRTTWSPTPPPGRVCSIRPISLFDLTISAPKLRVVCVGPAPQSPVLTIHGPGWMPTMLPIRTQGCLTMGFTIDLAPAQVAQPISTRATLTRAATILYHQRVPDTAALVASISTMAKAAYPAQFYTMGTA